MGFDLRDTGIPPNFVNVYHNLHHTPCKNGECEAILGGVISIFRHTPHRSFCFTFIKLMLQTVQRRPMNYCNSAGFRDRNPEWTTKCWAHTLPKIAKVDSVVHMYVYNCVYIYIFANVHFECSFCSANTRVQPFFCCWRRQQGGA